MNCAYKKREKIIDSLMAPIDHVKKVLWADYHDAAGEDFNEEVTVWHNPEAGNEALLASVREQLSQRGYILTTLWELAEHTQDGKLRLLWMDRQWFEGQLDR